MTQSCGEVEADEESRGETTEESVVRLQQKTQHFVDASTMGQSPRTVAGMEWSQPQPRRKVVCAVKGGVREVALTLSRSPEDCE